MFTVIIAEKDHIDAIINKNKLFFEPFFKNKDLAFCCWNPSGQSLSDSVPDLQDIVGRKKEWRAVIINPSDIESIKSKNPFDSVSYGNVLSIHQPSQHPDANESWDEWEKEWIVYYEKLTKEKEIVYRDAMNNPLQKLTTWISFKPEDFIINDLKRSQDSFDWDINSVDRSEIKPSIRLEIMEKHQYKVEMALKEKIRREFIANHNLNIAYPSEMHCIALRTMENKSFDPNDYWNIRKDTEYSKFADRNMYYDRMRFIVFDLFPYTHKDYRTDYIRFLASVLIFASNQVQGSVMQPRRVYLMETDTDDSPLCKLVTSYDKKLAETISSIDNEIDQIESSIPGEMTDEDVEKMFCTPQEISVVLDEEIDKKKFFANEKYGLSTDCPKDEFGKWQADYIKSEKELGYVLKHQMRAIRKGTRNMHIASRVSDTNISRLTSYQIEDIAEYTNSCENEMIENTPTNIGNIDGYKQKIDEQGDKIKKIINQRMSKKTTVVIGAICLVVCLICFLPFIIANSESYISRSMAMTLVGVTLGLFVVIMVGSLFKLRGILKEAIIEYNGIAKDIIIDLEQSIKKVSNYLSSMCNVRRGRAVEHYSINHLDKYTKSIRIRKKHKEDIKRKKAYLMDEYRDYYGGYEFCDETMSQPYDYDFDQNVDYKYPAPFLAGDYRQIEFLSNGNMVTVPLSYVTKILVRVEEIYE